MDHIILYNHETNIQKIHKDIISYYKDILNDDLNLWIKERDFLKKRLNGKISMIERKDIENKISIIDELESRLTSEDSILNKYIRETSDIIDEYRKIQGSIKKVFGKPPEISSEQRDQLYRLIKRFSNKVNELTCIKMIEDISEYNQEICPECYTEREVHENEIICKVCEISELYINRESYQPTGRKSTVYSKNEYSVRDNFIKELERMQAKQKKNNLPHDMFEKLDMYFRSKNLPTSDKIKKMPKIGRKRGKFTKHDLRMAISSYPEFRQYYKQIDLITKLYWDWDPIVLTDSQFDKIMEYYDSAQRVLSEIAQNSRKSSISIEYSKFRYLKLVGVECTKSDFNIVCTQDILNNYESMWKEVCERLGWEFIPISSYK
jgi:hypothetical protein